MRRAFLASVLLAVSCGTTSSTSTIEPDAGADAARVCANDVTSVLPACASQASPAPDGCRATRTFLDCEWSNGVRGRCGSDGTTSECDASVLVDAGEASCRRGCCPDEYALSCRGGPMPPGCREGSGIAPGGGGLIYCCRC